MNKYYKAIDSVHAKQSSVEKALAAAVAAEQSGKVIEMTKTKKKLNIRAVSAIAACMVAVIAGSAIFGNNGSGNAFTIKANAATLNGDSYVYIGELNEIGGSFGEKVNGDGSKEYSFSSDIGLALDCEGDNIKSVKYTGENCLFDFLGFEAEKEEMDGELATPADYNGYENVAWEDIYKSYKTNYDEKIDTEICLISAIATDNSGISDDAKQAIIDWNNHASYRLGESVPDDYDDSKFNIQKTEKAIFKHLFKNMKIKAEIEFKDGTVKTETIKIICNKVNKHGGAQLSAKIGK